jgi:hypothetical protein
MERVEEKETLMSVSHHRLFLLPDGPRPFRCLSATVFDDWLIVFLSTNNLVNIFPLCVGFGFVRGSLQQQLDTPFKLCTAIASFSSAICIPSIHLLHVQGNNVRSVVSMEDMFVLLHYVAKLG